MPQALAEKVAITAYRPLLGGLLAGKYAAGGEPLPKGSRAASDTRLLTWLVSYGDELEKFSHLARDAGLLPAQLAIAWVRKSVAVTAPIVGVRSLSQLKSSTKRFAPTSPRNSTIGSASSFRPSFGKRVFSDFQA